MTYAAHTGKFSFGIDGVEIGTFMECTGLTVEIEVEELVEGGENNFVHQLPGRMKWPHIVLKRGVTDTDALFEWLQKSSGDGFAEAGNKVERATGHVSLLDPKGEPIRSWEFQNAFPVKWTGPSFAASSSDVATEELEIVHHGFVPPQ